MLLSSRKILLRETIYTRLSMTIHPFTPDILFMIAILLIRPFTILTPRFTILTLPSTIHTLLSTIVSPLYTRIMRQYMSRTMAAHIPFLIPHSIAMEDSSAC
jgi:dolichol kinase